MKTLKLFAVTDKVNADGLIMTGTAYTAGAFIRDSIPFFNARKIDFFNECNLYQIADLDESSLSVSPVKKELIPWDAYKHPEIPVTKTTEV